MSKVSAPFGQKSPELLSESMAIGLPVAILSDMLLPATERIGSRNAARKQLFDSVLI